CPVCNYTLTEMNGEVLDVHFAYHCMHGQAWCCKGVLKEDAAEYGLDSTTETYIFLGRERVGGCLRTFFERWELESHL
ncbi:hypothetical protein C8R43DRAFT_861692, partial [Mycena crocata]